MTGIPVGSELGGRLQAEVFGNLDAGEAIAQHFESIQASALGRGRDHSMLFWFSMTPTQILEITCCSF